MSRRTSSTTHSWARVSRTASAPRSGSSNEQRTPSGSPRRSSSPGSARSRACASPSGRSSTSPRSRTPRSIPETRSSPRLQLYHWLSWLQEEVVEALSAGLPQPPRRLTQGRSMTRPPCPRRLSATAASTSFERIGRPEQRGEHESSRANVVEQDRKRDRGILGAVEAARQPLLLADQVDGVEVEPSDRRPGDRRSRWSSRCRRTAARRRSCPGSPTASKAKSTPPGATPDRSSRSSSGLGDMRRAERERLLAPSRLRVDHDDASPRRRSALPGRRTAPPRPRRRRGRLDPAVTPAENNAAPTPVSAAQPRSAACSSGIPPPVGNAARAETTTRSAMQPVAVPR